MTADYRAVAELLMRLPEAVRPDGSLQIVTVDAPYEPNPLAPTLILLDENSEAGLPAPAIRTFEPARAVWLIPPTGAALMATLGDTSGRAIVALYIPAQEAETAERSLDALRQIVYRLRRECPWDRTQTHQSLTKYVLEEAYEVVDAIEHHGPPEIAEELGDLLLQVFLQAEIAEQAGTFALNDVVQHLTSKLIRRHPHVFANVHVDGAADVEVNWDALKQAEQAAKAAQSGREIDARPTSVLDGIPRSLPALMLAAEQQKRMRKTGFQWAERSQTEAKLAEELAELQAATTPEDRAAELGDALYVLTDLANWHGASAEAALRGAIARVDARFRYVEETVRARGVEIRDLPLDELVRIWQAAKTHDTPQAAERPQPTA